MIIWNLIIISFIITYIIGSSGILFDLSKFIYELTHKDKKWNYQMLSKPFGCSICMNFWIISIYSINIGSNLIYGLGYGCAFAIISVLIDKIIKLVLKIINKIE